MQWCRWFYAGVSCVALLVGSSTAQGQTPAKRAEELFNKALELSDAKKYAEACPLLAASQRLDPTPGTLFALSDCEVEAKKYASAVIHFKEYLREFEGMKPDLRKRHEQRANTAKAQIKRLEPQLSTLKLTFAGGIPSGTTVQKDGEEFSSYSIDTPVPVDPGEHSFVIKFVDQKAVEQKVDVPVGGTTTLMVMVPRMDGGGSVANAPSGKGASKRQMLAVGILGAGAAGLAFGGAMGGLAVVQQGVVGEQCRGLDCSSAGIDAVDKGRLFGDMSTIGLAAGGALAVTGTILFLTAPKSKTETGFVTRIGGSAGLGNAFLSVEGQF